MAENADGKLRFSRQYFLVFVRKKSHLTLQMKSKYAKEHSTAHKVGCLEFISERPFFPVPRANAIFFGKTELETIQRVSHNFSSTSRNFRKKNSRSVIESHQ